VWLWMILAACAYVWNYPVGRPGGRVDDLAEHDTGDLGHHPDLGSRGLLVTLVPTELLKGLGGRLLDLRHERVTAGPLREGLFPGPLLLLALAEARKPALRHTRAI